MNELMCLGLISQIIIKFQKRVGMGFRLTLHLLCFLGLMISASALANSNKLVGTKLAFEQFNITVPFNVSLPIIALDIVTGEASPEDELIVIGEDESGQPWLALYTFHEKANEYTLLDKMILADKYFAFDIGQSPQALYFLAKDTVASLGYKGNSNKDGSLKDGSLDAGLHLQLKQDVSSIFLLNESSFISKRDFIQDVNKDGLDDIILPDFEQTNLWLASKGTQKTIYQSLALTPHTEIIRNSVNFEPVKLFFADLTLDGRQDIAWVSQGNIHYFRQTQQGEFSSQQESHLLAETISGLDWWQIREADGESPDQSNLTHRVVEQVKDINGDGLVDIIVRFTQSSGVLDRANDYEFYFGFISNTGQLQFSKTPNTVIKAEGTLTGLKIIDVNKDNKYEVLLSSFELSISNIIGALLAGGIDQNVLLFALNDENSYEDDALISKEVELNFSLTSGKSGQPIVLLSDVNGDDLQDLILSSGEEKIAIYLGQQSSKLFNRKASKHKVLLPKNGELFEHHDLNHDGKEDFIMRYGRLDDESMANKITILMVK